MSQRQGLHQFDGDSAPQQWTWSKLRTYMADKYGKYYTPGELRAMEIKWKRAFAEAGWSVKGQ